MPLTALASRYRRTPYDDSDYPPGVLSPFEDDSSPALDPSYYDNAEAQGQTASDPQPQQQPLPTSPTPPDTTASAGLETLPPLNPAQPANGDYSGLRKLTTMPAPGSAAPVPATTQAPQAPSAAAPAPGADTQATIGQLNTLQKPDAPTSNWAQRLGMAILSMTKLAPVANQIIHPKWSQQEGAYEAQKGDIESRLKDQEGAENTLTLAQQRQAKALELSTQNVPHKGQQQIDPDYAKENLPFLIPDAQGQYWVDKSVANTLTKPDKSPKLTIAHPGDIVLDDNGHELYRAPDKPNTPTGEYEKDFLPYYAQTLGKTVDQMTPQERIAGLSQYKVQSADPAMRDSALAMRQLTEQTRQLQLSQQPTQDWADTMADAMLSHRIAPDQLAQLIGGFGGSAGTAKRMVTQSAMKKDPQFNFEQASSDYAYGKSPAFQNTVRMMNSALNTLPRLQQSANTLANGKVRSINQLINAGQNQFNSVDLKRFQTDALLAGDEIAKVIQGGGTGSGVSDAKLKQAGDLFKTSDDPRAIATALQEVQQILGYRRQAVTRGTYMENDHSAAEPAAPGGGLPYVDGGKSYNIPANLEKEFLRDHPNAKKQ